jgi:hypothetical protein
MVLYKTPWITENRAMPYSMICKAYGLWTFPKISLRSIGAELERTGQSPVNKRLHFFSPVENGIKSNIKQNHLTARSHFERYLLNFVKRNNYVAVFCPILCTYCFSYKKQSAINKARYRSWIIFLPRWNTPELQIKSDPDRRNIWSCAYSLYIAKDDGTYGSLRGGQEEFFKVD